ncbi:MAG: type III-B CRISPR module-associated Cmr3 family protein [Mycobacteriaceae bacterium]
MTTTWVVVELLDTAMVRDGRPFDAGSANISNPITPPPSTFGGVLHTALGKEVGEMIIGPTVVVEGNAYYPTPVDIVKDDTEFRRLTLEERSTSQRNDLDSEYRFSHETVGEGKTLGGWIRTGAMENWLTNEGEIRFGEKIDTKWIKQRHKESPGWSAEPRLGLARHYSGEFEGTAMESMLYATTHLRGADKLAFMLGCVSSDTVEIKNSVVPLGGRGRIAHVRLANMRDKVPHIEVPQFDSGRVAIYLATPGLVDKKFWSPEDATLCVMSCTGPQPIATASVRKNFSESRQLQWALPAGTVLYVDFGDKDLAQAWANNHHEKLLNPSEGIVNSGFGVVLTGRW